MIQLILMWIQKRQRIWLMWPWWWTTTGQVWEEWSQIIFNDNFYAPRVVSCSKWNASASGFNYTRASVCDPICSGEIWQNFCTNCNIFWLPSEQWGHEFCQISGAVYQTTSDRLNQNGNPGKRSRLQLPNPLGKYRKHQHKIHTTNTTQRGNL